VRVCRDGEDWAEPLGIADHDEADRKDILTYWQAQDLAREGARVGTATGDLSIKAQVERYRADLENRGQDPANALRVLAHLSSKLADRVATASSPAEDLREFRDHLVAKGLKPATIDRTTGAFKAALSRSASSG
jgi:hypothetical protein